MYNINPQTRELLFLIKQIKVNRKFIEGINYDSADENFNGWYLLNEEDDIIAVTPLFNFDSIESENSKILINNNVVIANVNEIEDNIIVKSNNNQNVLIYENVVLNVTKMKSFKNDLFLLLRVCNEYADFLTDIPIDLYYSEDGNEFNLIKSFKSDVNGMVKYFADKEGKYKFKYKNVETEVINV